jgi:hypothetical protein
VKQLHLLGYQQRTKFEDEARHKILIGKHCSPMRAAGKISDYHADPEIGSSVELAFR